MAYDEDDLSGHALDYREMERAERAGRRECPECHGEGGNCPECGEDVQEFEDEEECVPEEEVCS